MKWFDGIGECRIDWVPGYRIYLAQDGKQLIVLFGGGTKKDQQSDIDRAKELHQEYKKRKKEANKQESKEKARKNTKNNNKETKKEANKQKTRKNTKNNRNER
ncbi:MAG: hypothetical protein KME17_10645 [Cyanosarcina radialis HA8281-LM2]|nr:hypothetical protein [Cyanosarcina radialis HA8281-LM2]